MDGTSAIRKTRPCSKKLGGGDERDRGDWVGDRIGRGTWWVWAVLAGAVLAALVAGWIGAVTWPGTRERLAWITRCRGVKRN